MSTQVRFGSDKQTSSGERSGANGGRVGAAVIAAPSGLGAQLAAKLRLFFSTRSFGGGASQRRMKLLETLSLGGKRQLMLVRCDDQTFLVGTGGEDVNAIVALHTGSKSAGTAAGCEPDRSCRS